MSDAQPTSDALSRLDDKGRCCGRKPIFYKGGSWRSPPQSPMHFCCDCSREFGPDGKQRPNWAWMETSAGVFERKQNRIVS